MRSHSASWDLVVRGPLSGHPLGRRALRGEHRIGASLLGKLTVTTDNAHPAECLTACRRQDTAAINHARQWTISAGIGHSSPRKASIPSRFGTNSPPAPGQAPSRGQRHYYGPVDGVVRTLMGGTRGATWAVCLIIWPHQMRTRSSGQPRSTPDRRYRSRPSADSLPRRSGAHSGHRER